MTEYVTVNEVADDLTCPCGNATHFHNDPDAPACFLSGPNVENPCYTNPVLPDDATRYTTHGDGTVTFTDDSGAAVSS